MQPTNPIFNQIKSRVTSGAHKKEEGMGLDGMIYQLARELHCLGDILGREYQVYYDSNGRITLIKQKPMSISKLITLWQEAIKDDDRHKDKSKPKTPSGSKMPKMVGR